MLANAEHYAETFDKGALPMPPARGVVVLTCMNARLNPYGLLGLSGATRTSSATPAAS